MAVRQLLDTSFMARGACRGLRHIMFPPTDVTGHDRNLAYKQAVEICLGCPVLDPCLEWALMEPDPVKDGVVAGLHPNQLEQARKTRAMARRENYVPPCGTPAGLRWHLERGEHCEFCLDRHNRRSQPRAS
jgi:hypothetical protein